MYFKNYKIQRRFDVDWMHLSSLLSQTFVVKCIKKSLFIRLLSNNYWIYTLDEMFVNFQFALTFAVLEHSKQERSSL